MHTAATSGRYQLLFLISSARAYSDVTYGLLDLTFVGLDLLLQFVDHLLHPLLALSVLVSLEC